MDKVHLLIAVVEFSPANGGAHRLSRIRIREQNCTGRQLYEAIQLQVCEEDEEEINVAQVEIFDAQEQDFVPLLRPDIERENIIEKFGARVRCIAREKVRADGALPVIAGRFYPYNDKTGIQVKGKHVLVKEMSNLPGAGTGVNVWDGAILLTRYLEQRQEVVRGKRVLELGSGCGIVGIVSALLGASEVILTDLPYVLPLMNENVKRHMTEIEASGCKRIECMECDWFNPRSQADMGPQVDGPWQADVLLLADCVWVYDLVAPLLRTIKTLITGAASPISVIISYQRRGKSAHEAFMRGLNSIFTEVTQIDAKTLAKPDALSLLECRNR